MSDPYVGSSETIDTLAESFRDPQMAGAAMTMLLTFAIKRLIAEGETNAARLLWQFDPDGGYEEP